MFRGDFILYYFAYGSNLNKKQMRERCPESKPLFTAALPNYKLVFTGWVRQWHGGVAGIRSMRGAKAHGAVYEVTERCLKQLDKYENGYQRFNVTVFSEDSEPVAAVTYIKTGQLDDSAPSKEYLAVIQQGLKDWQMF